MHTPSHALLTWALAERASGRRFAAPAVLGAVMPDGPIALGAGWLFLRKGVGFGRGEFESEVCARTVFRGPDAALHSVLPVGAALALRALAGTSGDPDGAVLAFLLGWAGHVLSDSLTHTEDARPLFWPLSGRRFRGPVSYWDRGYHARAFSILEHASLLLSAMEILRRRTGELQRIRRR